MPLTYRFGVLHVGLQDLKKERHVRDALEQRLNSGSSHSEALTSTVQQLSRDLGMAQDTIAKSQYAHQAALQQCEALRGAVEQRDYRARQLEQQLTALQKTHQSDAERLQKLLLKEQEMDKERARLRAVEQQASEIEARNNALQELVCAKCQCHSRILTLN